MQCGVDARTLGKPDVFHGEEARWVDGDACVLWLCDPQLAVSIPAVEVVTILSIVFSQSGEDASSSLFCMFVLLTRNEPMNIVVNSGKGEGLVAWRRLAQRKSSAATLLSFWIVVGLVKWIFSGGIQPT